MRIVLTDTAHLLEPSITRIKQLGATVFEGLPTSHEEVVARAQDAEILVTSYVRLDKSLLSKLPALQYLIVPAAGYQGVDLEYARERGIVVMNCPTHNAQAVAEHAMALLFSVARKLHQASSALREKGEWQSSKYQGLELAGKQAGIIGYGNIGKRIGRMMEGIGMYVMTVDARSDANELDALLRASDVVCLSVPLTPATHHLLNKRRISLLKQTAIVLNISRGQVIEQPALVDALRQKRIWGAGLDVLDGEPVNGTPVPPKDDERYIGRMPVELMDLVRLDNVVATPHMGYGTYESAARQGEELLEVLTACQEGKPINVVSLQ